MFYDLITPLIFLGLVMSLLGIACSSKPLWKKRCPLCGRKDRCWYLLPHGPKTNKLYWKHDCDGVMYGDKR